MSDPSHSPCFRLDADREVVPAWSTRGVFRVYRVMVAVAVSALVGCGGTTLDLPDASQDAGGADSLARPDTYGEGPLDSGGDAFVVDARVADSTVLDVVVGDVGTPDVTTLDAGVVACPAPAAPVGTCGAALCGNGQIDSCPVCGPCGGPGPGGFDSGGTCCTPVAESCDGTDLGGATCTSLGFSGGTLRCNVGCGFDVSGCTQCGTDSKILACANAGVDAAGATALALAASSTQIALAWITAAGTSPAGGVHVAVLSSTLSVLNQTACLGATDASRVAMAATPSGWIVAIEVPQGIAIYPLAADGSPAGSGSLLPGASVPILAAQPSGGPLLVWTSSGADNGYASFLGTDASVGVTVAMFAGVVEPQYGSAVFVGDGFLVGLRANNGATVAHVSPSGVVGMGHSMGSETEYPQVAWTGEEARIVYADFSGNAASLQLVRLDATGAPLSTPVMVGSVPEYYDPAPNVTAAGDSVVLLPGYTGGTGIASHLDVTRVSPTGQPVYAPYVLDQAAQMVDAISPYYFAVRGPEVIAAWVTGGSSWITGPQGSGVYPGVIGIARLTP
jgi:hypothetical protein